MRDLWIDLGAISQNLETMRAKVSGAKVMVVVKANAYGHGMLPVAEHRDGVVDFGGVLTGGCVWTGALGGGWDGWGVATGSSGGTIGVACGLGAGGGSYWTTGCG